MLLSTLTASAALLAQSYVAPDYSNDDLWLCLPDREDACTSDLTATRVKANGRTQTIRFREARNPKVDCFYVYPTVSFDPSGNSDLEIGEEERSVAEAQLARFRSVCDVYAPMYRQVTITALRSMMMGQQTDASGVLAYADVAAAFEAFISERNGERPYVLIGHSQGARLLTQLVARRIEGSEDADGMLSAMLIGFNVEVPEGELVGGDLKQTPLCTDADETGCAIAYVSFKSDNPPPANSRFGRTETEGMEAGCTNPAGLLGRDTADAYLAATPFTPSGRKPAPWTENGEVETTWVTVPGLIETSCTRQDGAHYLSVKLNADPADPRTDDIGGEVTVGEQILDDWGLHLLDVNLVQGDLIELIKRQERAYRKNSRRE